MLQIASIIKNSCAGTFKIFLVGKKEEHIMLEAWHGMADTVADDVGNLGFPFSLQGHIFPLSGHLTCQSAGPAGLPELSPLQLLVPGEQNYAWWPRRRISSIVSQQGALWGC